MSDPNDYLSIKRGILQYVWFKPFYCLATTIGREYGWDHYFWGFFWALLYNISATLSLYNLALFWKCLYGELQKYNPWSKFLCVKLAYHIRILLARNNYRDTEQVWHYKAQH